MQTFDHPATIVFGLDVKPMCQVINRIGNDVRSGRSFRDASHYGGLIEGYARRLVPVAGRFHQEYFGFAIWHCRHAPSDASMAAGQCLWPDRAGLFPGSTGYHPANVALQPILA